MAGLTYTTAEFNTIITMLGCLCATVQSATGAYAAYKKRNISLLKTMKYFLEHIELLGALQLFYIFWDYLLVQ